MCACVWMCVCVCVCVQRTECYETADVRTTQQINQPTPQRGPGSRWDPPSVSDLWTVRYAACQKVNVTLVTCKLAT